MNADQLFFIDSHKDYLMSLAVRYLFHNIKDI